MKFGDFIILGLFEPASLFQNCSAVMVHRYFHQIYYRVEVVVVVHDIVPIWDEILRQNTPEMSELETDISPLKISTHNFEKQKS